MIDSILVLWLYGAVNNINERKLKMLPLSINDFSELEQEKLLEYRRVMKEHVDCSVLASVLPDFSASFSASAVDNYNNNLHDKVVAPDTWRD